MITLEEMRYFVAAYDCSSLSQAAQALNISAQGLGRAIGKLEHKLGISLFTRTFSGIVPTSAAARVYNDCRQMLTIEAELLAYALGCKEGQQLRFVGRDSEIGDTIRLGIEDYNETAQNPVAIEMTSRSDAEIATLMQSGACDLRFVNREFDTLPWFANVTLGYTEYRPLVNEDDPVLLKEHVTLADLEGKTVLSESPAYTYVRLIEKHYADMGISPVFRFLNIHYALKLLSESDSFVFFARDDAVGDYLTLAPACRPLALETPLRATIMLQTSHESIDPALVACVQERMRANEGFVVTPPLKHDRHDYQRDA